MTVSIWSIRVNGSSEQFATNSANIEEALVLFKQFFKGKNPQKSFNVDNIQWVTAIPYLDDTPTEEEMFESMG